MAKKQKSVGEKQQRGKNNFLFIVVKDEDGKVGIERFTNRKGLGEAVTNYTKGGYEIVTPLDADLSFEMENKTVAVFKGKMVGVAVEEVVVAPKTKVSIS